MARLTRKILIVIVVTAFATTSNATELDPDRIGWSELRFRASKFFMTFYADVRIATPEPATAESRLIVPGAGKATEPLGALKIVSLETKAFGRLSRVELILNAASGAALQRTSHDSGKRFRHRIYRFTDRGAYQRTRRPVGKYEERLPADQWPSWSDSNEGMRPYPPLTFGAVIAEPSGLLYIVGAASLDVPGDTFEILAYARNHVHLVQIEVIARESIKLKYRLHDGTRTEKRDGKQPAIRMLLHGQAVGDVDSDDQFELLGLRGNIVLHVDAVTRAPLQLEGRVKIAGYVKMRLIELTTTAAGRP